MIRSMTGFGRSETVLDNRKAEIEIKSLNHKFLEILVRLPGTLAPLELNVKKKITERISRGRVEVSIRRDSDRDQAEPGRLELNMPLIREYYNLMQQLKKELKIKGEITLEMLMGIKEAITYAEAEVDLDALWAQLEKGLDEALDGLLEMRLREGEALRNDLVSRIGTMRNKLDAIRERTPLVTADYRERLTERVKELSEGVPADEARIVQEVVVFADRSDITEEIVRFQSHLSQLETMLNSDDAVGRKLDFLLQEIGREANTIGSKSPDAEISQSVVDVKAELARVREQVQNIE